MSNKNQHIKEYLEYYVKLENPQYAVLLNGKWGCGKTYFIKNLLQEWSEDDNEDDQTVNIKPIYVSLNGISSISHINEKIRAEINPILYSKAAKIGKKLLVGLAKATLKVDFDKDGNESNDGSLSLNLDASSIFNSANDKIVKGKRILIFDDIERCKLPTDEIFGYVNDFVEHSRCKVVLIADEEKIQAKYHLGIGVESNEKAKSDNVVVPQLTAYKDFKEKLIGQTFELETDIDAALDSFLDEKGVNNKAEIDFDKHKDLLKELFIASNLRNLRVLKQSLFDFKRLLGLIDSKYKEHPKYDDFIKNLLAYFIITYSEYRTGNELIKEYQSGIGYLINDKKKAPLLELDAKYDQILDRFKINAAMFVFPIIDIVEYIQKGYVYIRIFNQVISTNTFFAQEKEISGWEKLLGWMRLEDDDFTQTRDEVWQILQNEVVSDLSTVLNITGVLLSLESIGLFNYSKAEIISRAKRAIDKIFENHTKTSIDHVLNYRVHEHNFVSDSSPEFDDLRKYMIKKAEGAQVDDIKGTMKELFEGLTSENYDRINEVLSQYTPDGSCTIKFTPIFKYVDGEKLAVQVNALTNTYFNSFSRFIFSRYNPQREFANGRLEEYHKDDKKCLVDLMNMLIKSGYVDKGMIRTKLLDKFISDLGTIIVKLEEHTA